MVLSCISLLIFFLEKAFTQILAQTFPCICCVILEKTTVLLQDFYYMAHARTKEGGREGGLEHKKKYRH